MIFISWIGLFKAQHKVILSFSYGELGKCWLKDIAIKCRSKKELYVVLQSDCGVNMPPISLQMQTIAGEFLLGRQRQYLSYLIILISISHKRSQSNTSSTSKEPLNKWDHELRKLEIQFQRIYAQI